MDKKRKVIGTHAFYFKDAAAFTIPAAGTAGRAAKPGAEDPLWFDLGVSEWKQSPQNKIEDFMEPAPGMRQRYDRITTSRGLMVKGQMKELSNLIFRMLLGLDAAFPLTGAGGQYNPLEGDPVVRGWLQLQQYDETNTLFNTCDYFVAMEIPGDVEFGDKPVDVDVEARVLFSTLNTGTLV